MDKNEFEIYQNEYASLITNYLKDDVPFYYFGEKIKWSFVNDENLGISAACDRKTNLIQVNINWVQYCIFNDDYLSIEYFLLHELRHAYQHYAIWQFKQNNEFICNKDLVLKWIHENNHYIKAIDENGNENPKYFDQDCEYDAFVFSYAVMLFKYGKEKIRHLYGPSKFGDNFFKDVQEWITQFECKKDFK